MARLEPSSISGIAHVEKAVVNRARELFEDVHWVVEEGPLVGAMRPDLVLRSPEGSAYVVELRVGRGSSHFGSLAQVATFKEEYEEVTETEDVQGLLVTNMTTGESLMEAAESLGIQVVPVGGDPGEMAEEVFRQIYRKKL